MAEISSISRDTRFAYTCNGCSSCCRDPHIALDPYEIARLARSQNLTTTEFISRYLTEGGIVLRKREDTSCVMLDAGRCTVYADRPQICRTYPLKRLRRVNNSEVLLQYPRLPTSTGAYGTQGTISDFLKANDTEEFFSAKDRYLDMALRIAAVLAQVVEGEPRLFGAIRNRMNDHCEFRASATPALIDVDHVVSNYCREHQLEFRVTLDEKLALHARAIEERLAALSVRRGVDKPRDPDAGPELLEMAAFAGALGAATESRAVLAFVAQVFGR